MTSEPIRHICLADVDHGKWPAPRASAVVVAGGLAHVSGLRATDPHDARTPIPEFVEDQVERIFSNLDRLLRHADLSRERLVAARCYVVDFDRLYARVAGAWSNCIGPGPGPAFTCVGVERLARGALVEMDFIVAA
ncbi:Endoribonuclease L-PSP [Pigmentiphaga humi]|uniref:Endoribonuclease L-PSP n=1 Tax=Pigmentiphaga humi TaxID=2478468 RepID=A0A3P4B5V6_9BURK|nr:RidA family protein [Pigmentiphaga humi]VCU71048.1 Endoribonuclease L-PSP [Pigmentiphaga humi]